MQYSKKRKKTDSETILDTKNKKQKKKSDKSPIVIGSEVAAKVNKEWILAKVSRYFPDKGKYEVIDENIDTEDSFQQHKQYKLDRDSIIPLQPEICEENKKGSIVLAIYPDTTVFFTMLLLLNHPVRLLDSIGALVNIY